MKQPIDQPSKQRSKGDFSVHFEPQTCQIWSGNEGEIVKDLKQIDLKVDQTKWYKP